MFLSFYSCAHQVHRATGLPNIIRRCATLHLRNVVVVNPGHEPWGGSFYYCDACLQCAFGISNGFYVISCQPAQVLIFGYATQPAKGHRPTGREWELVPSSKLRTGITEREFLTARPSTLEPPEPFHVLFRLKEGVNGLALNGTTPLPPCFQTSASTLLTT